MDQLHSPINILGITDLLKPVSACDFAPNGVDVDCWAIINPALFEPEFESWQPPVKANHLIRGPFDADTGGTKWCGARRRGTARCAPTRCTSHPR